MKAGDIGVQRATMHSWRNLSKTETARIFFVLISCEKLVVDGHEMKGEYPGGDQGKNIMRIKGGEF